MEQTENIIIRDANENDAERISSLLEDAFKEFKTFYTEEAYNATVITADEVINRMKEGKVWVAENDGHLVGTVTVVEQTGNLYIRGMAVLPSSRGKRIGYKLLQEVVSFAREKNIKKLELSTTPYLIKAISLYEIFGFIKSSETSNKFYGTPLFEMEKLL